MAARSWEEPVAQEARAGQEVLAARVGLAGSCPACSGCLLSSLAGLQVQAWGP